MNQSVDGLRLEPSKNTIAMLPYGILPTLMMAGPGMSGPCAPDAQMQGSDSASTVPQLLKRQAKLVGSDYLEMAEREHSQAVLLLLTPTFIYCITKQFHDMELADGLLGIGNVSFIPR